MNRVIESWLLAKASDPGLAGDYIERGKKCISKIVQMLKQKSSHQINHHFIGGSVGKNTTTAASDFDCYIFIGDIEYPFKNVLKNICILLCQNQPISGRIRVNIKMESPTVLTCIVHDNRDIFKVDFSIAKNYATEEALRMLPELDFISLQQKKTLDAIKPWPSKFVYKLNSGLSSAIVRYVRRQDDFTRNMIRLTKNWYTSLGLNQPNSRTMFEILAIHCAQRESNFPAKSLLRCFMGFLKMVESFDQLDVVFRDEYKFPEHQFDEETEFPRVMDPVNPYRNLSEFFKRDTKLLLEKYSSECAAAITLHSIHPPAVFELEGKIFKTQAQQSQFPIWFSQRVSQSTWLIETTVDVRPMGVQIRSRESFANQPDDYHSFVVFIKDNMNEIIDRTDDGSLGLELLADKMRSFIRTSFWGAKISLASNDLDQFHASVIYPIPSIGSIFIHIRF